MTSNEHQLNHEHYSVLPPNKCARQSEDAEHDMQLNGGNCKYIARSIRLSLANDDSRTLTLRTVSVMVGSGKLNRFPSKPPTSTSHWCNPSSSIGKAHVASTPRPDRKSNRS